MLTPVLFNLLKSDVDGFANGGDSMAVNLSGKGVINGFSLELACQLQGDLAVLTGRNGSGKTRLLAGIAGGGAIKCEVNGVLLNTTQIKFFDHKALVPNFLNGWDETSQRSEVLGLVEFFSGAKAEFDGPFEDFARLVDQRGWMSAISPGEAYNSINSIAEKLGKKSSQLSCLEVKAHYFGVQRDALTLPNLVSIFNTYVKCKLDNLFQIFLASRGKETYFVQEESFERMYGRAPWIVLNEIISDAFAEKYRFTEPNSESEPDPGFRVSLKDVKSGEVIGFDKLSSGEQTLLWLVLILFNALYEGGPDLVAPKLLLLDEPDAFLHPSMVIKMMEILESITTRFGTKIIITTHSPTTVALSPPNLIYCVGGNRVIAVDQDLAIAELLDGVTQISIDPRNRRQVFVESHYDARVYEALYCGLQKYLADSKVSLSFSAAGTKFPSMLVEDTFRSVFRSDEIDPEKMERFITSLNGVGCCDLVKGVVEDLHRKGGATVRGLIDRDRGNKPNKSGAGIFVIGEGICYAIENLIFDPVCVLWFLYVNDRRNCTMQDICGKEVSPREWVSDMGLLQKSVDKFILDILGTENARDYLMEYVGGAVVLTDSRYLDYHGHELARLIMNKHERLKKLCSNNDSMVMEELASFMVRGTEGDFIPKLFVNAFSNLRH